MEPGEATNTTHQAEKNLHLPETSNPWLKTGEDVLLESALDPTMLTGVGEFQLAGKALKAAGAGKLAAKALEHPQIAKAVEWTHEPSKLRKGALRPGEDVIKGTGAAGQSWGAHETTAKTTALAQHEEAINAVDERQKALRAKIAEVDQHLADLGTTPVPKQPEGPWNPANRTQPLGERPTLPEKGAAPLDAEAILAKYGRGGEEPRSVLPRGIGVGEPRAFQTEQEALKAQRASLAEALEASNASIPPEVRRILQQRIFREGTGDVRAQKIAEGYAPEAGEAESSELNMVHKNEPNYLPEHHVLTKEEKAALQQSGPVTIVRQGNRKATFDIEKHGATPDSSLYDRIVNRTVRGIQLEAYHRSRREALEHLGVIARPGEDAAATAARRALTLKPGAPEATQSLEIIDPVSAQQQALREMEAQGIDTHGVKPGDVRQDTKQLEGRVQMGERGANEAEKLARLQQATAQKTASGAQAFGAQYGKNVGKAFERVGQAAAKQGARTEKLGAALENHALVRAGLQSGIPGLRASTKELQAAYVSAKKLATLSYTSGLGKQVDETIHRIAAERLDRPAGTNLTVIGEGDDTHVLGGQSGGFSPYSRADVQQTLAAMRRSRAKGAAQAVTSEDAERLLDEAMNATGEARDHVDAIAREYDLKSPGISQAGLAASVAQMRDTFKKTIEDVRGDLRRKPAVPGAITSAAGSVVKGQQGLQGTIESASQVAAPSMRRVVDPGQRAAAQAQQIADKARARVGDLSDRGATTLDRNDVIDAMNKNAKALQEGVNTLNMPAAVKERLFGDLQKLNKSLPAAFADLQRHALFILPFAHMKNISILAALGPGGMNTVRKGVGYAIQLYRNPAALADRVRELEEIGAIQEYAFKTERAFEKTPLIGKGLGWIADRSAVALQRYDTAMRMALEDVYRAKGITGFAAAGQIRDVLGDYQNKSQMVQWLASQLGANFPHWGLGIVPQAMSKALREHPRAVNTYARTNRVVSDDVTEPAFGADVDMGSAPEDAAKLALAPLDYVSSRSRSGAFADVVQGRQDLKNGHIGEFIGQEVARVVPFSSALGIGAPPSNAPGLVRAAAGLGGIFFPSKKTRAQKTAELSQIGYRGRALRAQLEAEGYYDGPGR